ncbi:MAG TPA: flagellar motor protein MotA [Stellaceae bacterium]|nr:flagellar motor protein MotA [Stellaceae bacterium]
MSHPSRYLTRMTIFVIVIALIAGMLSPALYPYFMGNPVVNGVIVGILVAGVIYIFHQVVQLSGNARWLARASRGQPTGKPSRLLGALARMIGEGRGRLALSATALRTLLDSIGSRLDETRETSRYLIGLLIFLGLLGTFYGLLETVQSVKGVIGGLSAGAADPVRAFADLKARLGTPLGGMSTAFSASLFGLAGSLVLGFLDLQAGLAQNRFFNELEEWLTAQTRLDVAPAAFAAGEGSAPAYIQALLEQTADTLDNLQRVLSRGEESRISANANIINLTERLAALTDQMRAEQGLMLKLAEQQLEMKPVLTRLADGSGSAGAISDESRAHLRAIEVHLARLTEDVSQGRGEAVQEIRNELRLVARTIAALRPEPERTR